MNPDQTVYGDYLFNSDTDLNIETLVKKMTSSILQHVPEIHGKAICFHLDEPLYMVSVDYLLK